MPPKPAPKQRSVPRVTKPKMTPLKAAISSKKNSVRVTRLKSGEIRYKITGPLTWPAVIGAGLLIISIMAPTSVPWVAGLLAIAAGGGILWTSWMLIIRREGVDTNYEKGHLEGGRRATGAKWFAVKGGAAWAAVTLGLITIFLWLHPDGRLVFGLTLAAVVAVGVAGLAWRLRARVASSRLIIE